MRFAGIVFAALLLTGCGDLYSLHPLFTKADQAFDPALEGRWEDDDNVLTVERRTDLYWAIFQSKRDASEKGEYEVHLVDIAGVRFADLLRQDEIGHMFVRTRAAGNELRLTFLDSAW